MRKSDKKLDNQIIKALTTVCHIALEDIEGFQWLTHTVKFDNFPQSLKVICVFDNNKSLASYAKSAKVPDLVALIAAELENIGIELNNINNQVEIDSEENCQLYHAGNWNKRLA